MEISVGSILDGNVKSITKFGAFVVLPGGRSGLVHISEIAHSYVSDVKDFLQEGQQVRVKVVGIDDAGRINLSIKKATPPPPRPQNAGRPFSAPRQGGHNMPGSAPRGNGRGGYAAKDGAPAPRAAAAKEPGSDFEFRLKQFMQSSDSKLSDLRMNEKRNSRRSGHK